MALTAFSRFLLFCHAPATIQNPAGSLYFKPLHISGNKLLSYLPFSSPSFLHSSPTFLPLLERCLLVLDLSAHSSRTLVLVKERASLAAQVRSLPRCWLLTKSLGGAEHPPAWLPAKPFPLSSFCVSWEHVSNQPYKWKLLYFILDFNSSFFGLQENSGPSKAPWDSFKTTGDYQHYTTINVLDTEAKDALELRPAEWEKCLNLPLDVQEGDFQTEV